MENNYIKLSWLERLMRAYVQHYNHDRYWRYREKVVCNSRVSFGDLYRIWYIKRSDAFSNASTGTHLGFGAEFTTPPQLPHGLYGIIISHNAKIGSNCCIFHQVTIGEGRGGAPIIGDNVLIGAGSKLIGGIHIGNFAKIGVGCVVMKDIPDYAIVVADSPKIILKNNEEEYEK